MELSIQLLKQHIEKLNAVLSSVSCENENTIALLDEAKKALSETPLPCDNFADYYKPAVYNALAEINTSPCQTKINRQLTAAVTDARDELCAILDFISEKA